MNNSITHTDGGRLLEALFTIFLKMDSHLAMPTMQWYEQVTNIIDQYGREKYQQQVLTWLDFRLGEKIVHDEKIRLYWQLDKIKPGLPDGLEAMAHAAATTVPEWYAQVNGTHFTHDYEYPAPASMVYQFYYTVPGRLLRGVIHTAAILRTPKIFAMVETFGINCPEECLDVVHVYEQLPKEEAICRIMQLRERLHSYSAIWRIDERLRRGLRFKKKRLPQDIKAAFVSTHGLDGDHKLSKEVGAYQLQLDILHYAPFKVIWQENGRVVEQPSSTAIKAATSLISELRGISRKINRQLADECKRMEVWFLEPKSWTYRDWWPAYILHPLTGAVGKRLIWLFTNKTQQAAAIWTPEGAFVTAGGTLLDWIDDRTIVTLWNPITASPELIAQWQCYMMQEQIKQPFRQAFREVYRLPASTPPDADIDGTFAGHILALEGMENLSRSVNWDYSGTHRSYRDIWASFRIERLQEFGHCVRSWGASHGKTWYVEFFADGRRKVLLDVRPEIYSECLHDIDLFVRTLNIGNDPLWEGQGDENIRSCWYRYAFDDLLESAKIRRIILKHVIPYLSISGKVSLEGNFMRVQGGLHSYKIHIGSANVLRESDNTFIRLNTDGKGTGLHKIFMPVERDKILSVIICKALLLAEDREEGEVKLRRDPYRKPE